MATLRIDLDKARVRPSNSKIFFTYTDIARLPEWPEGPLIEIINGDLYMTPSPTPEHQTISMNLIRRLDPIVHANNLGKILTAPIDLYLSEDNYVIPDIIFVSESNKDVDYGRHIRGVPDLIIEIVSSNRKLDYVDRKVLYEKYKVKEYWIVDKKEGQILVYILKEGEYLSPIRYAVDDTLTSNLEELKNLKISVAQVFAGLD